jgi:integrase
MTPKFVSNPTDRAPSPTPEFVIKRLPNPQSKSTGVMFSSHAFRHTYATELLRNGVPAEVVRALLVHASVTTTVGTYAHLTAEDARRALVKAGML